MPEEPKRLARESRCQQVRPREFGELDLANIANKDVAKIMLVRLGSRFVEVIGKNSPETGSPQSKVETSTS